jgi:acyl carrier protein
MLSTEETYRQVSAILIDALNVEEDEIKPTSALQNDLGAESIDFLDIIFRLERNFGIKISQSELFPESIFQNDPEMVQGNRVTAKGLERLRARIPFADFTEFEKDPEVGNISKLFTVELITKYVQEKLRESNGQSEAPASSGDTTFKRISSLAGSLLGRRA